MHLSGVSSARYHMFTAELVVLYVNLRASRADLTRTKSAGRARFALYDRYRPGWRGVAVAGVRCLVTPLGTVRVWRSWCLQGAPAAGWDALSWLAGRLAAGAG
jgi:hypothetical protein